MSSMIGESHRNYIDTIGDAFPLILIAGLMLALSVGVAYATGITPSGFQLNGISLAFLIGALVALVAMVLAILGVALALFAIHDTHKHTLGLDKPQETPKPQPASMPQPEPAAPALATTTTNQANDDYKKALLLMESILRETRKLADGEKPDNKPFSYDNCHAAGFFSRWEDWSRILKLLEAANLGIHLKKSDWNITVNNIAEANQRLKQYYTSEGFVQVNGIWMKK